MNSASRQVLRKNRPFRYKALWSAGVPPALTYNSGCRDFMRAGRPRSIGQSAQLSRFQRFFDPIPDFFSGPDATDFSCNEFIRALKGPAKLIRPLRGLLRAKPNQQSAEKNIYPQIQQIQQILQINLLNLWI